MNFIKNIPRVSCVIFIAAVLANPTLVYAADTSETTETITTGNGTSGTSSGVTSKAWTSAGGNSWTMDTDNDGVADITLSKEINSDGDEEWTYTFNTLSSDEYFVYEDMTQDFAKRSDGTPLADGYTSKGQEDNKAATVFEYGKTENQSYTIENSKDHTERKFGSLTIKKVIEDVSAMYDENDTFNFNITLGVPDGSGDSEYLTDAISGMKVFGETVFTSGKATISLGANESITITGIPEGIEYTVSEQTKANYAQTSRSGDSGAISSENASEAVFTNKSTYIPPESKTTSFKLTKVVNDIAKESDDTEFVFNILFEKLDSHAEVTAKMSESDDVISSVKADESGTAEMTGAALKNGQTLIVSGVTIGARYQVQESAGEYTPQYVIANTGDGGSIAQTNDTGSKNTILSTSKETAEEDEDITITYTNTIDRYQNLVLTKKSVDEDGNPDTEDDTQYEISATLSGLTPGYKIRTTSGTLVADSDGIAETTYLVSPNAAITLYDVPVGTIYRFTEEKNSKIASYVITDDGKKAGTKIISASGSNDEYQKDLSTGRTDADGNWIDEVVDADENVTVTFTNKSPATAKLKVTKYGGTKANPSKKLGGAEFELYYENGDPVNYTVDANGNPSNLITINNDGTSFVLESELFVKGNYYLVETKAPDGYMLTNDHLAFTIAKEDLGKTIEIKAYDDELVTLPVTGGTGRNVIYITAGVLAAAMVILIAIKRKTNK